MRLGTPVHPDRIRNSESTSVHLPMTHEKLPAPSEVVSLAHWGRETISHGKTLWCSFYLQRRKKAPGISLHVEEDGRNTYRATLLGIDTKTLAWAEEALRELEDAGFATTPKLEDIRRWRGGRSSCGRKTQNY